MSRMPKAMPAAQSTPTTVSPRSRRPKVTWAMTAAMPRLKATVTGSTGSPRKKARPTPP